ncbi:hypothetical protein FOCG_17618 [Fusarium oxysporum f. sp. radicis-lycopersici 26381]|nr:hypothetical protein FOCG_17618 [Fusarium oxysporum f. sp. radicis-lycopersici 26381]
MTCRSDYPPSKYTSPLTRSRSRTRGFGFKFATWSKRSPNPKSEVLKSSLLPMAARSTRLLGITEPSWSRTTGNGN